MPWVDAETGELVDADRPVSLDIEEVRFRPASVDLSEKRVIVEFIGKGNNKIYEARALIEQQWQDAATNLVHINLILDEVSLRDVRHVQTVTPRGGESWEMRETTAQGVRP